MSMERLITRPQSLLRSFFGLGPDQFSLLDTIIPTLDVDVLMRSVADCQVLLATSAPIAPGARGNATVSMPAQGTWLVHAVSLDSSGPATSGNIRMGAAVQFDTDIWAVGGIFSLFDKFDSLPKMGVDLNVIGKWFDRPLILHRDRPGNADAVIGILFNEAASVGNATVRCHVLARQLEALL